MKNFLVSLLIFCQPFLLSAQQKPKPGVPATQAPAQRPVMKAEPAAIKSPPVSAQPKNVVELFLPKSDKIVLKYMFRNGSMCDPAGLEGLTFLSANLVSEGGTKEMISTQVKDFFYPMAAASYVTVDKEVTVFTFEFPKDFTEKVYSLIKGLLYSPRFAEDDFERLKSNQQNYIDEVIRSSSDEEYSKKALEEYLFSGIRYSHPKQGYSASIKEITLQDVKEHYKMFFTNKNLTIGIAGNYRKEFIAELVKDADLISGIYPPLPELEFPKAPDGISVKIISKNGALGSAIFTGTSLEITRAHDDFAALMIANSWLGEHRKSYSRLYQKIRQDRSMNYGDYSYIEWYENGGGNMLPQPGYPRSVNYFSIWIRPVQTAEGLKKQYAELSNISIGHAHFALRMAVREMELLVNNGMTESDFQLTRTFLRSYIKLYVQTPSKQLGFLMDSRFYGRKNYIEEMDTLLANAKLESVNEAMRKYWKPQNMYVAIVTDESEADSLRTSLVSGSPSPMSYSDALRQVLTDEIKAEDDVVAGYPLNVTSVEVVASETMFRNKPE